jgi:hypothetical protein
MYHAVKLTHHWRLQLWRLLSARTSILAKLVFVMIRRRIATETAIETALLIAIETAILIAIGGLAAIQAATETFFATGPWPASEAACFHLKAECSSHFHLKSVYSSREEPAMWTATVTGNSVQTSSAHVSATAAAPSVMAAVIQSFLVGLPPWQVPALTALTVLPSATASHFDRTYFALQHTCVCVFCYVFSTQIWTTWCTGEDANLMPVPNERNTTVA